MSLNASLIGITRMLTCLSRAKRSPADDAGSEIDQVSFRARNVRAGIEHESEHKRK